MIFFTHLLLLLTFDVGVDRKKKPTLHSVDDAFQHRLQLPRGASGDSDRALEGPSVGGDAAIGRLHLKEMRFLGVDPLEVDGGVALVDESHELPLRRSEQKIAGNEEGVRLNHHVQGLAETLDRVVVQTESNY